MRTISALEATPHNLHQSFQDTTTASLKVSMSRNQSVAQNGQKSSRCRLSDVGRQLHLARDYLGIEEAEVTYLRALRSAQ